MNVPTTAMAAQVDVCGTTNGRTTDKFALTGLTLAPSSLVETPLIEQCPFNLECRVTQEVQVGSYVVVIGEIVEAHAEEDILSDSEGTIVDVAALDPLIYIAGSREYRGIGAKVADAYSVGKTLTGDATD